MQLGAKRGIYLIGWFGLTLSGCSARPQVHDLETSNPAKVAPPTLEAATTSRQQWQKGSLHVHAAPSGDSRTPVAEVVAWYESRGYGFIALTDHNRVTEVDSSKSTLGKPFVRDADKGVIVLSGVELTYNPDVCDPPPPPEFDKKCRIHVNAIGVTGRPADKLNWADRSLIKRADMYGKAADVAKQLGGDPLIQMNHPNWFWGVNADVVVAAANRGFGFIEIANVQFAQWNAGDATHPSIEQLWDAALARGAALWGVASDDAHDYTGTGEYPAGGGFVMVEAVHDSAAILQALRDGEFYSSTGVLMESLRVENGILVVRLAGVGGKAAPTIEFIENGKVAAVVVASDAQRALPSTGYLRLRVTAADGSKAWSQPYRR
jgi:hypothetical protein